MIHRTVREGLWRKGWIIKLKQKKENHRRKNKNRKAWPVYSPLGPVHSVNFSLSLALSLSHLLPTCLRVWRRRLGAGSINVRRIKNCSPVLSPSCYTVQFFHPYSSPHRLFPLLCYLIFWLSYNFPSFSNTHGGVPGVEHNWENLGHNNSCPLTIPPPSPRGSRPAVVWARSTLASLLISTPTSNQPAANFPRHMENCRILYTA